jgi:sugar phosphate isomerase/epimerase
MVNIEVSVITDEFSEEFDEVCEYLQQNEVKYIEIRNVWMANVIEMNDDFFRDSSDIIKDCGLKVSCIAGPLLKCIPPTGNPNPGDKRDYTNNWKYNFEKIDRAVELAEKYDAKYIRVFGFQGKWPVKGVDDWADWSIYKEWTDAINMMKKKAAAKNKILVCENESGICSSLEQIARLGKDHCDDQFGILFDTANAINTWGKFGILEDECLDILGKYIKYIHAKGCKFTDKGTQTCLVNEPDCACRWPEIVAYFKNMSSSDFIGAGPDPLFMSIETHMDKKKKWENSAQSLKNLQALL